MITRRQFIKGVAGVTLAGSQALGCSDSDEQANTSAGDTGAASNGGMADAGVSDVGVSNMVDVVEDAAPFVGEPPPFDAGAPWWVNGNYAPVDGDFETFELRVEGALPPELDGIYVRNGPNPTAGHSGHWFLGDGMLHGVRLEKGKALWYRSRQIQTNALTNMGGGGGGVPDISVNQSNTSIIYHGDKLLSLVEVGLPTEIAVNDLSTKGVYDFQGALDSPMTAHPKIDPRTGKMYFFGYWFLEPYLMFHEVSPDGQLVRSVPIEVPGATMIHDFQITDTHVIFMDLPMVFNFQDAIAGVPFPFVWTPDYGARIGVMPLDGDGSSVTWFDIDNCYVFHTLNAFKDPQNNGALVLDAVRHPELWLDGPDDFSSSPTLWRWNLDMSSGMVREEQLDDRNIEFPQFDRRRQGLSNRYGYSVLVGASGDESIGRSQGIIKYDMMTGQSSQYMYPEGRRPDEAIFVPAHANAGEDEGWLLTYVYDEATYTSSLDVLDASNLSAAPVARVLLPRRVPHGFHGTWIPQGV